MTRHKGQGYPHTCPVALLTWHPGLACYLWWVTRRRQWLCVSATTVRQRYDEALRHCLQHSQPAWRARAYWDAARMTLTADAYLYAARRTARYAREAGWELGWLDALRVPALPISGDPAPVPGVPDVIVWPGGSLTEVDWHSSTLQEVML